MKKLHFLLGAVTFYLLSSCSPVNMSANQYQLSAYSQQRLATQAKPISLLVTAPEAGAGYQTNAMLYVKKPYQLESFAKNSWVDTPANMFYPLLIQSIQRSGFFAAVSSSSYTVGSTYRLDTQLLRLEQSFLVQPSVLNFSVKVVLTRISDNKILASKILNQQIPCSADTPYGGVIAANKASLNLTMAITHFVIDALSYR